MAAFAVVMVDPLGSKDAEGAFNAPGIPGVLPGLGEGWPSLKPGTPDPMSAPRSGEEVSPGWPFETPIACSVMRRAMSSRETGAVGDVSG